MKQTFPWMSRFWLNIFFTPFWTLSVEQKCRPNLKWTAKCRFSKSLQIFNLCEIIGFTASMKIVAFWDMTPWSLVEVYPDDGSSTHLWNVGLLLRDYMALYPTRLSSSFHLCFKPYCIRRKLLQAKFSGAIYKKISSISFVGYVMKKKQW
jgi:hypothetical protein